MAAEKLLLEERIATRRACVALSEAHIRQLDDLQAAATEETQDATRAAEIQEETLRLKYESMVVALREKVAHEQDVQSRRALTLHESTSRAESDILRRDVDAKAEVKSMQFHSVITFLRRRQWPLQSSRDSFPAYDKLGRMRKFAALVRYNTGFARFIQRCFYRDLPD